MIICFDSLIHNSVFDDLQMGSLMMSKFKFRILESKPRSWSYVPLGVLAESKKFLKVLKGSWLQATSFSTVLNNNPLTHTM